MYRARTMARPIRRPGNLPAETTSFIGRDRELAEVRRKLTTARLVSLVGPGGVGKTRLALRSATDLRRGFVNGAWLVSLAEVRDPAMVGNAVLAALDLRDQAAEPRALLLSFLRDKELLLVVDNCEHLLGAVARLVTDVLEVAPGVRVIATSREPLAVPGEHVLPIPPLELPGAEPDEPLDQVRRNDAVALFTDRASAASGTFQLTPLNQTAVVDLCRRLDGLPLAIELAAVRTRAMSPIQILDRLGDRFALLTGGSRAALPRHQTLRTTIEWSHDLLAPEERTLLRRLCVFAGRFTLEDVETICASDAVPAPRVLDVLCSLVDKSLVVREEPQGPACYRLHETMREFGVLKLQEAGEEDWLEERCTAYYVSSCLGAEAGARYDLIEWLGWMDLEIDNIRSVLGRCLIRADVSRGMDLAASLRWFWYTRATTEGVRWLDGLLAIGPGDSEPQARAEYMRGMLAVLLVDPTAATPHLERAAAANREAGRLHPLTDSLSMASIAAGMAGDRVSAHRLLDEAAAAAARIDDVGAALAVLQARAFAGLFEGDLEGVRSACSEGERLSREVSDLYGLKTWLMHLGMAAFMAGELGASRPLFAEALRIAHRIDDRVQQGYLLNALGCHAARSGRARLAAQLLGASDTMRAGAGNRMMPFLVPMLREAEESAVAALGAPRFAAAFEAGSHLSRDAAVRLAIGEPDRASVAAPDVRAGDGSLSMREAEVARLLADGLSNKEIGTRLFISVHTVDSHVRNILNKLGVNSRAQVAARMASSGQQRGPTTSMDRP
jgi:predicted ATPase/DNA-binding CsgD family transcriptional regulator